MPKLVPIVLKWLLLKVAFKNIRCEQGSNLRGKIPLDFKSNALTTRPSQLMIGENVLLLIPSNMFTMSVPIAIQAT